MCSVMGPRSKKQNKQKQKLYILDMHQEIPPNPSKKKDVPNNLANVHLASFQ